MKNTIVGDLIDMATYGQFDVILHGCNCFCNMGKGIAVRVKATFPEAYVADLGTVKGDRDKLGTYSVANVIVRTEQGQTQSLNVINAYTQYRYGRGGPHADYEAIKEVANRIANDYHGSRIGYPKIGAGLAGGDWDIISDILDKSFDKQNHTLVIWEGDNNEHNNNRV